MQFLYGVFKIYRNILGLWLFYVKKLAWLYVDKFIILSTYNQANFFILNNHNPKVFRYKNLDTLVSPFIFCIIFFRPSVFYYKIEII